MRAVSKLTAVRVAGALAAIGGAILLVLSPFIGDSVFSKLWAVEPLAYIGAVLVAAGMLATSLAYVVPEIVARKRGVRVDDLDRWVRTTQDYFDLFHHDLGRPLRRILGKERELRALLASSSAGVSSEVKELLDEIEGQAPNFRLMMSNIQVLVQLEMPGAPRTPEPVEPSEIVRRIVDRYGAVAEEAGKSITWWTEPTEFGIVYADSSAMEHIVTNLVDNALRFARSQVEVKLTRNQDHFFVRVWDDGGGISPQYLPHIFDRGWTPQVARREEKNSSGIGLFIAKTLAEANGGALTVESSSAPDPETHTTFLLGLPLGEAK